MNISSPSGTAANFSIPSQAKQKNLSQLSIVPVEKGSLQKLYDACHFAAVICEPFWPRPATEEEAFREVSILAAAIPKKETFKKTPTNYGTFH